MTTLRDEARDSLRYELKFACQEAAYERVRSVLHLHPAGIRRLHPTRTVQSIYFDTPFGRALEENRAGVSRRNKLRLRWYGSRTEVAEGVLFNVGDAGHKAPSSAREAPYSPPKNPEHA